MAASQDQHDLQHALRRHQSGDLQGAAALYRQLINRNPNNFPALHFLGLLEASAGNFDLAKNLMGRSLSIAPPNPQFVENYATVLVQAKDYEAAANFSRQWLQRTKSSAVLLHVNAIALFRLGRLEEALAQVDKVLALQPNHIAALNDRGSILAALNRADAALASVEKALALDPKNAGAFLNKGNLCAELKRYDEAVAAYKAALALQPNLGEVWLGLGNVHRALKRFDDALAAYGKALALNSGLAQAWSGQGNVQSELKRFDDALAAYDKALAINPELAEAWLGRGHILRTRRQFDDALAAYARATALKPDLTEAWLGRGNVFYELLRYSEAAAAYDQALVLEPQSARALVGRGNVLNALDRHEDALAAIDRAVTLQPDLADAWAARGEIFAKTGRTDEAIEAYDKALTLGPDDAKIRSNKIFMLDFLDSAGFEEQQAARTEWWKHAGSSIAARPGKQFANRLDPDRRLKVGYVSADFCHHSAAISFRPVLINHDKNQISVTCYSATATEDQVTAQFRQVADGWREIRRLADDQLAEQIRTDQIDILVDLSGYSKGNRLTVFAAKPAPIQVSAWGHAAGTGLPTVDYLFADPVACPAEVRHLFAEKIYDLPCIISIDPLPQDVHSSSLPMLATGDVTFGVFNRASKVSESAVALWARILNSLPRSRMLMKHGDFDVESTRAAVTNLLVRHGITADRITLLGATPRTQHLAAFKEVDISLDPFPMNGGVSTWESLQMGVPVVAMLGNSLASRVGGAIVSAVGLADWVAETADGYADIAVKFASMPDHLAKLRRELPAMIAASAAGNSVTYTRAVEAAYRKMWTDYCRAR